MDNKIVGIILSVAIGLIMVGGVLSPIITNALGEFGDPVTYYNNGSYFFKEVEDGDVFTIERASVDDTTTTILTTNGENIPRGGSNTSIVVSDGIIARILPDSDNNYAFFVSFEDTTYVPYYGGGDSKMEFSFNNGKINVTMTVDGTTSTLVENVPYTRGYIPCVQSDAEMITSMRADGRAYVNENTKIVVGFIGYNYGYYFHEGDYTKTNNSANWGYSNELSPIRGTTDVYSSNVVLTTFVDGGEQTVAPTPILVPYEINGHKDSGAAYDLIGVIPVIVLVVVLFMAVGVIFRSRY